MALIDALPLSRRRSRTEALANLPAKLLLRHHQSNFFFFSPMFFDFIFSSSPIRIGLTGEKGRLWLSKALTISEGTTVSEACRGMAARRVDSVSLTDSNALLSGIMTDKDIATRVIAEGLRPEQTMVSKFRLPFSSYDALRYHPPNPANCASVDTTILDEVHMMHDGKFLNLPLIDKDGYVVACIDVLQITHAAISMVMTPNPDCPSVDTTILDEVHMMHDGKFLNLPLLDKDVLQITHGAISMVNFMFHHF
ncbi:hypothetical protein VNO80_20649 [Phaseolus coccineus]|uniref:CBS domain-containing protein n=1 Tax=Phaseolus coccineus TaxID=3886 RepID=A0AAN9M4P5_PHACN